MKKILSLFFSSSVLISTVGFSQTDCGNNAGFETGTTAGWVCKYGGYGMGLFCSPPPPINTDNCHPFNTVINSIGCINNNGINAGLTTGVDRHTIVDSNAYGTGIDPNSASPYLIPTVPPNGGRYAFRLGDAHTGGTNITTGYTGTCLGTGCYARVEAIRLTFLVTLQNAFFTYRYAAFFQSGGHLLGEAAHFEVLITLPDLNDTLIPGGYFKLVANNYNPYCPYNNDTLLHTNGVWQYSDWRDVTSDFTNYIGQNIAVEFRTSDCFPGSGPSISFNGACTTTCQNGVCCTTGPSLAVCPDSGTCTGTLVCSNQPGSHSAYAYIDAYCTSTVGINELPNNNIIRIYPNPMTSSSIIEIKPLINQINQWSEVVIYDVPGKELLRRKLTANKTEIRKGDLERGIYFVRVNEYIKKLIVE